MGREIQFDVFSIIVSDNRKQSFTDEKLRFALTYIRKNTKCRLL